MNKILLIGNLTRDPEYRVNNEDQKKSVVSFSIAVSRKYPKDADPDYFRCSAFGKTAEIIGNYFHKGDKIAIDGTIQTDNYTTKEGCKVYGYKVIIDNFDFLTPKKKPEDDSNPFA